MISFVMLANIVGISFGIVKTRINAQVLNWTSHLSFPLVLQDMYCNSEELPNSQILKQFVKQD